jgi:hypothetical protein
MPIHALSLCTVHSTVALHVININGYNRCKLSPLLCPVESYLGSNPLQFISVYLCTYINDGVTMDILLGE